ncbi:uncharacterized protein PHALS_13579 [Plasmopara halstedii]|uniref:Uncharacterized protein n=1 Tax=Plasmopara halstedii TaxID=4781 RepID=A0A0P1AQ57_PLAHL|nr:uncharacterized protein PHALS_13579 [Plasmopara halstedii]CEG43381.1 hypothetical protein PHALS_13579 [Plasmopara halstedii]|eukprot:XP_024579750.1 hypothetical protein PHALS_13579 [Plasmopara halstedii]
MPLSLHLDSEGASHFYRQFNVTFLALKKQKTGRPLNSSRYKTLGSRWFPIGAIGIAAISKSRSPKQILLSANNNCRCISHGHF